MYFFACLFKRKNFGTTLRVIIKMRLQNDHTSKDTLKILRIPLVLRLIGPMYDRSEENQPPALYLFHAHLRKVSSGIVVTHEAAIADLMAALVCDLFQMFYTFPVDLASTTMTRVAASVPDKKHNNQLIICSPPFFPNILSSTIISRVACTRARTKDIFTIRR